MAGIRKAKQDIGSTIAGLPEPSRSGSSSSLLAGALGSFLNSSSFAEGVDKKRQEIIPLPGTDPIRKRVEAQRRLAARSSTGYQSTVLTSGLGG